MRFPLTKEIQFIVIASDGLFVIYLLDDHASNTQVAFTGTRLHSLISNTGLWDVLDDEAVTKFVLKSGTKNEWKVRAIFDSQVCSGEETQYTCMKVSQLLTDRAIELGSRDNVTTMVIFF